MRDRAEAEEKRRQAAALAALPKASPALAQQLASHVATDSRGWVFNRLDPGSVHNVRVASGSVASGNFVLRGEYTYNGGAPGWVLNQYSGGKFDCIQFWDARIGCRQLRSPQYGAVVRSGIISALTDSGSSGHGCNSRTGEGCNSREINNINTERFLHWRNSQGN